MLKLVLILTLMIGAGTQECPNMCKCHNFPADIQQKSSSLYYTSVFCESFYPNMTQLLSNSTRDLRFSDFDSEQIENILGEIEKNLIDLPYLVLLEFTRSELGNFSYNSVEWLRYLSLTENHLHIVPIQFLNLSNLQTFDLSQNEIQVIEENPFELLERLELLNLSGNSLINLNGNSFTGLKSLKSLDLSRNKLSTIGDDVLSPLSSLQYLNLSSNHLESLNLVSFSSLILLQHLDVSWNKLARIAFGSLHLPSLARLFLAGNPLLERSREASILVGTGRKLQILDASRTGLKQVPAALTHSIRTLKVAGNSIRVVNCGDMDSYPLIQLIDFASNELEFIEEDALGRLEFLSVLYLSDNHIREIPRSLPEKLSVLHLEYNDIERVSNKDLLGLAGLEVLLLNDNKIRVVDEAAFGQLTSLVTLDLSRNPVTILQPGCLSGPAALQVLRLASIGIIAPAAEVSFPLSSPEHLITLDLSDSSGLARQLLADTAALAASRELQELDLTNTDLEYIRSDLLYYLPQLRLLHIKDNTLNCSELQWLASWMRRQNDPEYRDIVCASPADLWGTPLVDLQDPETSPIQTINQEVGVDSRRAINLREKNITKTLEKAGSFSTIRLAESMYTTNKQNIENNSILKNEVSQVQLDGRKYDMKRKKVMIKENSVKSMGGTNDWNGTSGPYTTTLLNNETENNSSSSSLSANSHLSTRNTIKQTSEVAITGTPTPLKQTVAASDLSKLTSQNANETAKAGSNKLDHRSFISEISRNLFVATKERTLNNTVDEKLKSTDAEESLMDMESLSPWNVSTGETSMFINNKQGDAGSSLHPGMLILAVGIMGAAAALAMLAAKFTRKRRNSSIFQQEDIEVSSLPSVTELW